eukprot:scaffold196444_cov37-Prasinocladus_malaysianus.AAC.1
MALPSKKFSSMSRFRRLVMLPQAPGRTPVSTRMADDSCNGCQLHILLEVSVGGVSCTMLKDYQQHEKALKRKYTPM